MLCDCQFELEIFCSAFMLSEWLYKDMDKKKEIKYWMKVYIWYYQEYKIGIIVGNPVTTQFWAHLCKSLEEDILILAHS